SKLVVASRSVVTTWDVERIVRGETSPTHSFTIDQSSIVDVQANTGDNPGLVAILTTSNSPENPSVVVLYNCVTNTEVVRWSGLIREGNAPLASKQIAIGISSGDILQYSPTEPAVAKGTIPRVQSPNLNGTVPYLLQWLSNNIFHIVYAEPKPEGVMEEHLPDQYNYIVQFDKRTNHVTDIWIDLPWEPYGLARDPGHQVSSLRDWGRFKYLCFVNDAHANDVGIIGCIGDSTNAEDAGTWSKISLGEDSITFPLSSDMDDTSLIGMAMDLSAKTKLLASNQANGDDPAIPPAPILYLYTNDCVVVAFHVVNEDPVPYPGMATAAGAAFDQDMDVGTSQNTAANSERMSTAAPTPGHLGKVDLDLVLALPPNLGHQVSDQLLVSVYQTHCHALANNLLAQSPFAAAAAAAANPASSGPTLGFGAFASAKPTFGQSGFGSTPSNSTAGTTTSAFGSSGFASFANNKPAFGQSSFGATSSTSATDKGKTETPPNPFGANKPAAPAFGQSSFGAPSTSASTEQAKPASTGFGGSTTPAPTQSAFGAPTALGASTFKVGSGFGAFSNQNTGGGFSAFSNNPKPIDSQSKPGAFGGAVAQAPATGGPAKSGSDAAATPGQPKFGQSAFGQSSFGQTAFGQSSFGQSAFGTAAKSPFATAASSAPRASSSTGSGFSAFASSGTGFGSVAATKSDTKTPAYLQGSSDSLKPATEPALGPSQKNSTGAAPKSMFGSNAAVSQPGFGARGTREKTDQEDDEDNTTGAKEKFPEEDADKLEPVTRYNGPGLFAVKSDEKGPSSSGLGGLDLKEINSSTSSSQLAFGKKIAPSDAAASATAAFKPTQATAPSSTTPASSPTPAAPMPSLLSRIGPSRAESAFSSTPTKGNPSTSQQTEEEPGSEEEPEGSVDLEDDVDDFLEDDGLEGNQTQPAAESKPTSTTPLFNPFGRGPSAVAPVTPSTSKGTDISRVASDKPTERETTKGQTIPSELPPRLLPQEMQRQQRLEDQAPRLSHL
ncbi:11092_t:CDS:2, partial [Acaulospora colombiana]